MHLLGIDLGTSSIKTTLVDGETGKIIASASFPESEAPIVSRAPGFAEQDPEQWWNDLLQALQKLRGLHSLSAVGAIGIAYQMHGLVLLDAAHQVLRDAIIWCDSRAISNGEDMTRHLGEEYCRNHILNQPGNFTAAKLDWVRKNEPLLFQKIQHLLLPGDYISFKLTGQLTTSSSALSEGIMWDFLENKVADPVLQAAGIQKEWIPSLQPVCSNHGNLQASVALATGLPSNIPIGYKAGDQPNNALSLQVFEPGELAATAGTSGVLYAVSDQLIADPLNRINGFAHVNHRADQPRIGMLMCINGAGSMNSWTRKFWGNGRTYAEMNALAASVSEGAEGVTVIPFGNGAERILQLQNPGASVVGLDVNRHQEAHLFRAVQEGIACSFGYGFDILTSLGFQPTAIRAGRANMFLSPVFTSALVNITGVPVQLYEGDGSAGAALGAGIGIGFYKDGKEAFIHHRPLVTVDPDPKSKMNEVYQHWKSNLLSIIEN